MHSCLTAWAKSYLRSLDWHWGHYANHQVSEAASSAIFISAASNVGSVIPMAANVAVGSDVSGASACSVVKATPTALWPCSSKNACSKAIFKSFISMRCASVPSSLSNVGQNTASWQLPDVKRTPRRLVCGHRLNIGRVIGTANRTRCIRLYTKLRTTAPAMLNPRKAAAKSTTPNLNKLGFLRCNIGRQCCHEPYDRAAVRLVQGP